MWFIFFLRLVAAAGKLLFVYGALRFCIGACAALLATLARLISLS
jgi:hypothetical protein